MRIWVAGILTPLGYQFGSWVAGDGESGGGFGGGDELDDGAEVGEGPASPVHRDEREEAVLDLVPLRSAGRVVAHGDLESGLGGELGEVPLPGPDPVAVRSPGIGGDQESGSARPGSARPADPAATVVARSGPRPRLFP